MANREFSHITANFDPRDLAEVDQYLSAATQRSIQRRVINRSASRTRKAAMKEIATVTTLKRARIKQAFSAVRRASASNLSATVKISGKRLTVHSFRGKPPKPRHDYARVYSKATKKKTALTRRPYTYQINRGEKVIARYIFLQRVKNRRVGFEQLLPLTDDAQTRQVDVAKGPSIPGLWQGERYNNIRRDIVTRERKLLAEDMREEVAEAITKRRATLARKRVRKA